MTPRIPPRPREVLQLLCCGYSNQEIGAKMCISQGTVKTHLRGLMNLFEAEDRTHLAVMAFKRGVVSLDQVEPKPNVER